MGSPALTISLPPELMAVALAVPPEAMTCDVVLLTMVLTASPETVCEL